MEFARQHGRVLRATLCEIERGVFYATYSEERFGPDTAELPRYQVGKSACEAKQQLEECVRVLGYETVIWQEAIVMPVFSHPVETVRRHPVVAAHDGVVS